MTEELIRLASKRGFVWLARQPLEIETCEEIIFKLADMKNTKALITLFNHGNNSCFLGSDAGLLYLGILFKEMGPDPVLSRLWNNTKTRPILLDLLETNYRRSSCIGDLYLDDIGDEKQRKADFKIGKYKFYERQFGEIMRLRDRFTTRELEKILNKKYRE